MYKKGLDNNAADTLSIRRHPEAELLSISSVVPQWCAEVVASYESDRVA